ncbi:MAG TPA: glycosyltransferase family 4 protein [Thermoanaerobaculia bacterium]|jgi:glycosyltransferase involved in cell wall biosynthesis
MIRVLQLTPRLPYPPTDGGRVVMLQIARALQRVGADVHVLSLNPRKHRGDPALAPMDIEAVDIDTSAHLAALLRAFRIGAPQLVARFYSRRAADALRARLRAQRFDVVQVESPFLLPYVPVIRESGAVVVLRSLNVEFRIWEQLAAQETNVVRRIARSWIARGLRRYEIAHLDTCDALVPITEEDARAFGELGCTKPMHVLPGGVEPPPLDTTGGITLPDSVGFLGSLDYRPNQEAALWIADELRPRLPKAVIRIGGSNAPQWLRERLGASLEADVPDAAAFIRGMQVMVAPIFAGGGMRIKIMEAMNLGRPVVATSVGASGMDVRHGEHILLADDAASFAAAVAKLLRDPSRARAIGEAGRRLVETRYASDALARGLLAFYEQLTESARVDARR